MPKYVCAFKMQGKDHDGYCSGEDARTHECVEEYVVATIRKDRLIRRPADLEWTNVGCTTGGSGYCKGFSQSYTLVSVLKVLDVSREMSKADVKAHIAAINGQIESSDEDNDEDSDEDSDSDQDSRFAD